MKYLQYLVLSLITLTAPVGLVLGGHWLWLGLLVNLTVIVGGDLLLKQDASEFSFSKPWLLNALLLLALPVLGTHIIALAWLGQSGNADFLGIGAMSSHFFGIDALANRSSNNFFDYCGAILGVGLNVSAVGTNTAHEFFHRIHSRFYTVIGRWLLSVSCTTDFAIEHVWGHHANVGTDRDPGTAKRGETVYQFIFRSSYHSFLSAWHLELKRLKRKRLPTWSIYNRFLRGHFLSFLWMVFFAVVAGWAGVGLFIAQSLVSKALLEAVNYIEHYGLIRKVGSAVKPEHSWNSNHRMSGLVLFSLTRHSAHHEKGTLPFWKLSPYHDAPSMPQGYLAMIILAFIPPLWFKMMEPKLAEWDQKYDKIENSSLLRPVSI